MVGRLLRRHQPALRRRHAAAEPGRDHAAVGDRRHARRRSTRAGSSTPASPWSGPRTASTTPGRPAPTAARAGRSSGSSDGDATCKANQVLHPEAVDLIARSTATASTARRSPTRSRPRPFVAQDQRARLPRLPVDRRADRRALPDAGRALHRDRSASGSPSPTASTSTRSTPRPSTAGSTSSSSTSPQRRPQLRPAAAGDRAGRLRDRDGRPRRRRCPTTRSSEQPTYEAALAAFESQPPVRILFDNGAGGDRRRTRSRASSSRSRACRCRAPRRARGTSAAAARWPSKAPTKGGSDTFTWDPEARPADDFTGTNTGSGGLWTADAQLRLAQPPAGTRARPT